MSSLKGFYADDVDLSRSKGCRAPMSVHAEFERKIQKKKDHKIVGHNRKNMRMEFLIHWEGTPKEEARWEKSFHLWQFEE